MESAASGGGVDKKLLFYSATLVNTNSKAFEGGSVFSPLVSISRVVYLPFFHHAFPEDIYPINHPSGPNSRLCENCLRLGRKKALNRQVLSSCSIITVST